MGELDENAKWLHSNAKGLRDVVSEDLLIRGGRLAYDPELFMQATNSGLDEVEQLAFEKERKSGLWQQNKELKTILLTCCVAAIVQYVSPYFILLTRHDEAVQFSLTSNRGWDQASITGANLQWPSEFNLCLQSKTCLQDTYGSCHQCPKKDLWIFGGVNAISFFAAAFV